MARHARRGPSALRLEILEPRNMLSGNLPGASPAVPPDPAASLLARPIPDATVRAQAIAPNDPGFRLQWGLDNAGNSDIDAPQAWGRTQGSPSTIVAVLDTGIDLANPEFAGRIWINPDASGSDGHPGDVDGWNFVANNADVQDDNGHGTHVSGIIGASGNNGVGVAGVDWNAQIMPLKVLDAGGNGSDESMARAIDFAVQHGARVINASWGGGAYSQAVADAIGNAGSHGVVFVTAAGNDGTNDDSRPFYPASYHLPNEIAVAAVDATGRLASFSNVGVQTVALAAPGVNILSTIPGGYAYETGTSMAAPFVAGVVSLVAGLHPSFNASQLVQQVLTTTKPLAGLAGKTSTGGIVDAARAVGLGHPGTNSVVRSHAASLSAHGPSAPRLLPVVLTGSSHHRFAVLGPRPTTPRPATLPPTGLPQIRRPAVLQVRPTDPYDGAPSVASA